MKNIQRYVIGMYEGDMEPHSEGAWVHIDDHQECVDNMATVAGALQQLLNERDEELGRLRREMADCEQISIAYRQTQVKSQFLQSRLDLATGLLRDLAIKVMDTPGFAVKHTRDARIFLSQIEGKENE